MDIFVARQPIFNRENKIFAYELLYRNSLENFFDPSVNSSKATAILITNSYINIGMENLIEDKIAFINFDETLINNEIPTMLDKFKVVIEVLENVVPDRQILSNLIHLKNEGYTLALDDFTLDYPYMKTVPLYDIIKVDFMQTGLDGAEEIIKRFGNENRKFLAEKIETKAEYQRALDLGYDYFQGYFFSKPQVVASKTTSGMKYQYIRIKDEMQNDEPDFGVIEKIIESDVDMSYKILKLVNTFSLKSEVSSIRHAISILGIREIDKWINFLMVQNFVQDEPSEFMKISVIRSKFAELICSNSRMSGQRYQASLAGLFSLIDVILGKSMEKILSEIPMKEDVKKAIIGDKSSSLYPIMNIILSYEKAKWESLDKSCKKIGIDVNKIPELYIEAVDWANKYVFEIQKIEDQVYSNKKSLEEKNISEEEISKYQ